MKKLFATFFIATIFILLLTSCTQILYYRGEELLFLRERVESDLLEFDTASYILSRRWGSTFPPQYLEFLRVEQDERFRILYVLIDEDGADLQYYYDDGILYFHDRTSVPSVE